MLTRGKKMKYSSQARLDHNLDEKEASKAAFPREPEPGGAACRACLSGVEQERAESPVTSCVSMKSNYSMDCPIQFKREVQQTTESSSVLKKDQFLHFEQEMKLMDSADILDKEMDRSQSIKGSQQKLKVTLKNKNRHLFEGVAKQGNQALLNYIYTELYITEGGSEGVNNNEHEVRKIETLSKHSTAFQTKIKCNDLFKSIPSQKFVRTVLSKGIAGIGKTVSVQKFILDWAEDKANEDVHFIFPFKFCDLNLEKHKKYSLNEFILQHFPEVMETKWDEFDKYKVVFILDGLDECRLPLDFQNNEICCDITKTASLDVLLTNLIRGNLHPSSHLWITSRPAAAGQIPPQCVHRVTEIRGFEDPEKEEFFSKTLSDPNLANNIISHVKKSRSLHIMCHIPLFCWISAAVLEHVLGNEDSGELPTTLTQMYIHFLLIQISRKNMKYHGTNETNPEEILRSDKETILKLGELAFQQLKEGKIIFYEEDLNECGVDASEALLYSGICTEIFKKDVMSQRKVYSFVHLSFQEFLAAVFVFHEYRNSNRNLLVKDGVTAFKAVSLTGLHKSAVDRALESKNGHLDLFIRFLLGISLDSNQNLLQGLLRETESSSQSVRGTVKYINEKIKLNLSPEKFMNLFYCLSELNDNSVVHGIQELLRSRRISLEDLSPVHWSALVFVLLTSEEVQDMFDLKKYIRSEEALLRLLPVVEFTRTALLDKCNLTYRCCRELASALSSSSSHLRKLDLSDNNLKDSGVRLLSDALRSPHCKLEILRLGFCQIKPTCCEELASVLSSESSQLKELDLSVNDLQDSGVELLSDGLKSPHCKLEILRLDQCELTEECCEVLASAIISDPICLIELDLSNNALQDSGIKLLSAGLMNPQCKVETLRLCWCDLTEECCDDLASALSSPSSQLKELDLSNNDLQDLGVKPLSAGLGNPHCKLETLGLSGCQITEVGCASLASALRSNPSHLRELDLSYNHPGSSGVTLLSAVLEDPGCKLEKLNVDHGGECRLEPGLLKYSCQLTFDADTAFNHLSLSEADRKVIHNLDSQLHPDHQQRFDCFPQVLCREGLSGRCYWEAEWSGSREVWVGLAYKGISRKGPEGCSLGYNDKSWGLECFGEGFTASHNSNRTPICVKACPRVGVYLDHPAGTLTFYGVSSEGTMFLYRLTTTFTESLYPGFRVKCECSVSLCQPE